MEKRSILSYETVSLDDAKSALVIIDQTKLPYETVISELTTQKQIWDAIYRLEVRGAPAIGIAGAMGVYLAAKEINTEDYKEFCEQFKKAKEYLDSSRPTAVNLSWALNRMESIVLNNKTATVAEIKKLLHDEAVEIKAEDVWVCKTIGEYGVTLIKDGDGVLTHCNAGQLATAKYGTATAPMYLAHEKGYKIKVYADETRPLLQGARLTSYELHSAGIDVTLNCDSASSTILKNGWVQAVFVGCDRVAANGDTANKVGTANLAICAKYYNVPVYICAPTSTIDMNCKNGKDIHIEERPSEEITEMWYTNRMAPDGVKTFNPAFDVTDNQCIAGIITEYGIAYPPFEESLKEIFVKKNNTKK
ncbi:MAG: S-methyl-5-thioribose-1-phosphate isomerase [Epulopiscium sp. Nuni2H_MBin003]|nr:MAG: S-methyl-5-thioribose-1-phosphate isomerase [Epulopiscium sp. Nuni2H_MBin003]